METRDLSRCNPQMSESINRTKKDGGPEAYTIKEKMLPRGMEVKWIISEI